MQGLRRTHRRGTDDVVTVALWRVCIEQYDLLDTIRKVEDVGRGH